jgi:hypothetical protein
MAGFDDRHSGEKKPADLAVAGQSILWEGGGDRENYNENVLRVQIPICNIDYAVSV